jgi:hypothetical protein
MSDFFKLISLIFVALFLVVGVLYLFLVHPVPGVIYILLALIYTPWATTWFKKRFGLTIPMVVKIILGLGVLWGTLAVGDLAEILGL